MKKLLTMSLVSLSILALSACNSSSSSNSSSENNNEVFTASVTTSECSAVGNPITSFQRVQMHYGLLRNQTIQTGETGGLLPLTVTANVTAGSTTINVDSTVSLVAGQLITYLANNFDYYVAEIESLTSNTITVTAATAVVSGIPTGTNVWNFYDEAYTANHYGQKAIADFSYRSTASSIATNSTHVIIGDDWLNDDGYTDRLQARYPSGTIINNAGDADGLCDLLADFDKDVTEHNPKYVWIASSISDYQVGVSQEDYKLRLQDLIAKVQSIGATAIVYDAVAGSSSESVDGVVSSEILANRYSTQVQDLFNAANTTVEEETEEEVVVTPPTETETPEEEEDVVVVVTPPTETETENTSTSVCTATAEPIQSFTRVQMHYDLLNGVGFISESNSQTESQGLASYTVSNDVSVGSTTINLDSTDGLVVGQLITYLSVNAIYRVATIESLTDTQITINSGDAVLGGISAGQTLWNFYFNPTHPNSVGSSAMADFGFSSIAGISGATEATHVLLGDSWFTNDGFEERLTTRFPTANFVNQSEGGNTLCELLEQFDTSVTPQAPDYVWINSSVNDYFQDVSAADFKVRMQNLIAKVQEIGAVAVVYDSAPAPEGTTDSGVSLTTLSQRYADQILDLLTDANSQ